MRSEKEIREEIKYLENLRDKSGFVELRVNCQSQINSLNFVLGNNEGERGEPRFTVAELEKIKATLSNPSVYSIASWEAVIDICKRQPDAIEALLEGKEWNSKKVQEALK